MGAILPLIVLFLTIIGLPALGIYFIRNNSKKRVETKKDNSGVCSFGDNKLGVRLELVSATGFILAYNVYKFDKLVCPEHANEVYKHYQLHNLVKAWWSLRGFMRTPFLIAQNHSQFTEYKKAYLLGNR